MTFYPYKVTAGYDESHGVRKHYFEDDGIMKVSDNGKVLFQKSIMQIFIENDLEHLIFPSKVEGSFDPIHVNDIQPVMTDGLYYKISISVSKDALVMFKNLISGLLRTI